MSRIIEAENLKADYIVEGTHVYDRPEDQILMDDPRSPYFDRAMGFYSEDLRQRFIDASMRGAGAGGAGLTYYAMLAKEGVRDFSIADVDYIDASNVGRIPLLMPEHIGQHKADVAADIITRMNPLARVRVYKDGVNEDNVEEFLGLDAENQGITVGFDGIEITRPEIGLLFHQTARKLGRFVISAVDVERGGLVTTFDPNNTRHTFETYNGAKTDATVEEFLKKVQGFQLPTIANVPKTASLDTLLATQNADVSLPTTLRSVLNATDLAMDEFEKLLTLGDKRYGKPHIFPEVHCVNPSLEEDFVTRFPRLRCAARIIQLAVRDKLGLNPSAAYSDQDREARQLYQQQAQAITELGAL